MSPRLEASPEGDVPGSTPRADNPAGSLPPAALDPEGGASTGSRPASMEDLALFSSGNAGKGSGVIVSTGAAALLLLRSEEASPVEDATFLPHPMIGAATTKQRRTAEMIRGMTHFGMAHLSHSERQSPLSDGGFARDTVKHETYSRSVRFPARGRCGQTRDHDRRCY